MKIKNLAIYAAAIAATFASVNNASADFGVNLATTTSDAVGTQATRLYNDSAFSNASEVGAGVGDPLWLVFDVDGDGIWGPTGSFTVVNNANYDGTAAGLRNALFDADDFVIQSSVLGPIEGRNNAAFTGLPTFLQTGGVGANDSGGTVKPTYAILFDDANIATGVTFGVNGALTANGVIPDLGNVQLRIGENTAADVFTANVVAIPEPSVGLYAGLGLGALALVRRRMRKA